VFFTGHQNRVLAAQYCKSMTVLQWVGHLCQHIWMVNMRPYWLFAQVVKMLLTVHVTHITRLKNKREPLEMAGN
jgi:hypothetical protein